ncbi:MAG: divalent-cation tolerance protein CutA [Chitinispirillaceae bacterium]|nr:divalent-cation tolerance protein CutA [Chitinispirillaceae bacterium]
MTDAIAVYVTTSDGIEARAIGKQVVKEHLAACANVSDGMRSIYHWEGKLCEESESTLLLKTRRELLEQLTARIRELHSYTCPCIVAFPIVGGNTDYLAWIDRETSATWLHE